jgi:hypothetical protein
VKSAMTVVTPKAVWIHKPQKSDPQSEEGKSERHQHGSFLMMSRQATQRTQERTATDGRTLVA